MEVNSYLILAFCISVILIILYIRMYYKYKMLKKDLDEMTIEDFQCIVALREFRDNNYSKTNGA